MIEAKEVKAVKEFSRDEFKEFGLDMKSAYEKQDYFKVVQILKVLQTLKFTNEGIKFTGIE